MKTPRIGLMGSHQLHWVNLALREQYPTKIISAYLGKTSYPARALCFAREIRDVDMVYNIYTGETFHRYAFIARMLGKKVVTHWIGTDVYNFYNGIHPYKGLGLSQIHLACSGPLARELQEKGVNSHVLPLAPFHMSMELVPMPKTHAVLAYLPEGREDFYGIGFVRQAAAHWPSLPFYVVANGKARLFPEDNIYPLGHLDTEQMEALYKKISILIRITRHDGWPMMVMEALAKGRHVICNQNLCGQICLADTEAAALRHLEALVKSPPCVNRQGHDYAVGHFSKGRFMDLWHRFCGL